MNASTGFDAAIAALKLSMSRMRRLMILPRDRPDAAQPTDLLRPDEQFQPPAEIRIGRDVAVRLRHKRLAAEPGQPLVHIGRIADLARLAVADDIDADRHLARHDVGDRLAHLRGELGSVVRLVAILLDQQLHQRLRPRQAADMRRQDAVCAELHGALLSATASPMPAWRLRPARRACGRRSPDRPGRRGRRRWRSRNRCRRCTRSRPTMSANWQMRCGDQFRMLDVVGAGVDDAGDQHLVVRDLRIAPHRPFMRMPRIGRLERDRLRLRLQDDRQHLLQRNVEVVRAFVVAPAQMQPRRTRRHIGQRVVHRLDLLLRPASGTPPRSGPGTRCGAPSPDRDCRAAPRCRHWRSPRIPRCIASATAPI